MLLPTRLVDVSSKVPYLDETAGQLGRYVALSYCWGRSLPLTTTSSTIWQRRQAIPDAEIPRTLREAMQICRILGVRYIWIDALCIIQDDNLDWDAESSNMGQYYENAYLTISACASRDTRDGCVTTSQDPKLVDLPYFTPSGQRNGTIQARLVPSFFETVACSVWWSRAWTLQERLMSRRIVYFGDRRLFFECQQPSTTAEDGELIDRSGREDTSSGEANTASRLDKTAADLTQWYRIVERYTECHLTDSNDKLKAIQGLAHQLRDRLSNEPASATKQLIKINWLGGLAVATDTIYNGPGYAYGLWLKDLYRGLLWRPVSGREVEQSTIRAPSWSWAKLSSPVVYPSAITPIGTHYVLKQLYHGPELLQPVSANGRVMNDAELERVESDLCLHLNGCLKAVRYGIAQTQLPDYLRRRLVRKDAKIVDNDFNLFRLIEVSIKLLPILPFLLNCVVYYHFPLSTLGDRSRKRTPQITFTPISAAIIDPEAVTRIPLPTTR